MGNATCKYFSPVVPNDWLSGNLGNSTTDLYKVPDAVAPIHAVSSHVATDKGPSKFRSILSDSLQPIATRGKKARGTLLVDIGCSSKRAPLSVSYYNEISGGHIGSCHCSEEGLCRPSTVPVNSTYRNSHCVKAESGR